MNSQSDLIQVSITGMGHDGEGVGRVDNLVVFVPGGLPGETVTVKITEKKKSFCRAKLVEIIIPSNDRITPQCPYYAQCGGCGLQHLDYQAQLDFKTQRVRDAISRIGNIDSGIVQPCTGMEYPWEYRNNIQYSVHYADKIFSPGFLKKQSHDIIPVDRCLLAVREIDLLAGIICTETNTNLLHGKKTGSGSLERIQIRKSDSDKTLIAVLYTKNTPLPEGNKLACQINETFQATIQNFVLAGIVNIVTAQSGRISQELILSGTNRITEQLSGLSFSVQAQSFFQVNTPMAEKLFSIAIGLVSNKEHPVAVDAYCGTGSLSLFLARQRMTVFGIESNPAAVMDAVSNSKTNRLPNARFIKGSFSHIFPTIVRDKQPTLLVADPPRSGISKKEISGIAKTSIQEILYISCDPGTLARDIKLLSEEDFFPEVLIPIDMFPQTAHVETVVLLRRKQDNF